MRAGHRKLAQDVRAIVQPYMDNGAVLLAGRKHPKLRLPNNRIQILPNTPSDYRALANLTGQLRRLAAM